MDRHGVSQWPRSLKEEVSFIYRTLHRWGGDEAALEDLVQEVLLVLWRRRDSYDPTRPLRPWITGIAFRVFHDSRRHAWRELPRGFVDRPDENARPEQQLATSQARALVGWALDRLPEKQRNVFILHELEGVPMRDIAESLDAPLFTLYSRLKAAKLAFSKEVRRAIAVPLLASGRKSHLAALPGPDPALKST